MYQHCETSTRTDLLFSFEHSSENISCFVAGYGCGTLCPPAAALYAPPRAPTPLKAVLGGHEGSKSDETQHSEMEKRPEIIILHHTIGGQLVA